MSGNHERRGPHGSTGIKFPKSRDFSSGNPAGVRTGRQGATAVPDVLFVERRTYYPVPVRMAARPTLGESAPKWIADGQAPCCAGCGSSFGFVCRRHHCRSCGMVFCGSCSSQKAKLPYLDDKEARVCQSCFEHLTEADPSLKNESRSMGAGVVKPEPNGQGFRIHIDPSRMRAGNSQSRNSPNRPMENHSTKCEDCAATFSVLKKRKPCKDCARDFCSTCTTHVSTGNNSSPREQQCKKCQILLAGNFTRSLLTNWKIKDLKALLNKQNVNISKCKEKGDLIDMLFRHFGGQPNLSRRGTEHERLVEHMTERMRQEAQSENQSTQNRSNAEETTGNQPSGNQPPTPCPTQPTVPTQPQTQSQPSGPTPPLQTQPAGTTNTESQQNGGTSEADAEQLRQRQLHEMREIEARLRRDIEEQEKRESQTVPVNQHVKLDDIKSEDEILTLSILDLKRVLLNNFVDYKGCCEKPELQDRVKRLWRENEVNKKKAEEQRKISDDPSTGPSTSSSGDDDICKICMDAVIDCVLLECGHMATCTKCGKQLAECPICRQYVVRAVHTFKA